MIKLCQRAGCPNFTHGCPFDFRFPPYFGLKLTFNLHNNVVLGASEESSFNQGFRNNQSSLVRYAVILTPFPLTLYTGLHLILFNLDAITSVCVEIKLWIQNIMDARDLKKLICFFWRNCLTHQVLNIPSSPRIHMLSSVFHVIDLTLRAHLPSWRSVHLFYSSTSCWGDREVWNFVIPGMLR